MHCVNCGKNIPSDSKFCQFCGKTLLIQPTTIPSSAEVLNTKGYCQVCGANVPTKYSEFNANIGMLVARRQMTIKGNMCKNCINKNFWHYTLTNIFLGWWGVISFAATCIFLVKNTFYYLEALGLKRFY